MFMTICIHAAISSQPVSGFVVDITGRQKERLLSSNQEADENAQHVMLPHWLSFSTAHRRDQLPIPATLSGALFRLHLVYPLASFDVSGQWPVYLAAAWPNEDDSSCTAVIHPPCEACQDFHSVSLRLGDYDLLSVSDRRRTTVKIVPLLSSLCTWIVPPNSSTMDLTIYNPIPLPGISAIVTFFAR